MSKARGRRAASVRSSRYGSRARTFSVLMCESRSIRILLPKAVTEGRGCATAPTHLGEAE